MLDVLAHFAAVERSDVEAQSYALHELFQLR
jgi:hypothetical protein